MIIETTNAALRRAGHTGLLIGSTLSLALISTSAFASHTSVTTYQAESATISQGVVESNQAGFTGSGFVNYNNLVGSFVEFRVNAPQGTGTYFINLRYANGTTSRRPLDLHVNGVRVNNRVPGEPSGAWTTWRTEGVQVQLTGGIQNTVRLTALASSGGPNLDKIDVSNQPAPTADWSRMVVDSTRTRLSPSAIGPWEYSRALYLYGQYLVWRRVGGGGTSHPYLQYIKSWVDIHVDGSGNIDRSINSLDNMLPANLCLIVHRHFGGSKYETCARNVRNRLMGSYFNSFKTSDGAVWHNSGAVGQNWLDGVFMAMPFAIRWGDRFGSGGGSAEDQFAAHQVNLYSRHLRTSSGLLKHAFDEQRDTSWANPTTGQSPEFWCRALGWFGMTHIEILDLLPTTHSERDALLTTLRALVSALATHQDPVTGLWYQVVDKGGNLQNWHETSCSSMHAYTILRAVEKGYVSSSFRANADRARAGVLTKVSLATGHDGSFPHSEISNISRGTNIGDLTYYLNRERPINDMHGLGAFLIMNEAFNGNSGW